MVPKGGLTLKLHVIGGLQGSFFFDPISRRHGITDSAYEPG